MKSQERLTRHQVLLFEGDFAKIGEIYQHRSAAEVIRLLVRRHLEQVERTMEQSDGRRANVG